MRFHIFASQDSHKNTSKELHKFVVEDDRDGRLYRSAAQELEEQGYEVNEVWMQDGDRIRINTQREQSKPTGRRVRSGYYPPRS
jgi:hypothetical protein